jgi:TetR/AcrR family transcriptional regulator, cholesterol catabolism regulator
VAKQAQKLEARSDEKPPAGRARPSRPDGARREQEVLDAATKVFHSRGYADASVQDIADELQILKGSLYYYIDSKEGLLFRLLDETQNEVQAILDEVQALEGLTPLELLHEYFARQVAFSTRNVDRMTIYYHDLDQLSEGRRRELYRKRRVHELYVSDLISQAQERGEVDAALDPVLTVKFMFGAMTWVYRWYRPNGKFSAGEVTDGLADFVTRSLGVSTT